MRKTTELGQRGTIETRNYRVSGTGPSLIWNCIFCDYLRDANKTLFLWPLYFSPLNGIFPFCIIQSRHREIFTRKATSPNVSFSASPGGAGVKREKISNLSCFREAGTAKEIHQNVIIDIEFI